MIQFTDLTGLASCAVAIVVAALMLPGVARIPNSYRVGLACVVALAVLIPFGGLPLAAYVRGVTGDLSIATLVLLVLALQRRLRTEGMPAPTIPILLMWIVPTALVLYPLALGMGTFDPYRLGYGNPWLLGALLLLTLFAHFRQQRQAALVITLAVLAWALGWYESPNLWDYLLDPWLAIYAVGALAKRVLTS